MSGEARNVRLDLDGPHHLVPVPGFKPGAGLAAKPVAQHANQQFEAPPQLGAVPPTVIFPRTHGVPFVTGMAGEANGSRRPSARARGRQSVGNCVQGRAQATPI